MMLQPVKFVLGPPLLRIAVLLLLVSSPNMQSGYGFLVCIATAALVKTFCRAPLSVMSAV